jgi:hypothetical protein
VPEPVPAVPVVGVGFTPALQPRLSTKRRADAPEQAKDCLFIGWLAVTRR